MRKPRGEGLTATERAAIFEQRQQAAGRVRFQAWIDRDLFTALEKQASALPAELPRLDRLNSVIRSWFDAFGRTATAPPGAESGLSGDTDIRPAPPAPPAPAPESSALVSDPPLLTEFEQQTGRFIDSLLLDGVLKKDIPAILARDMGIHNSKGGIVNNRWINDLLEKYHKVFPRRP